MSVSVSVCLHSLLPASISFPGDNFESSNSLVSDTETVLQVGHLEKFNFNQVLKLQTDQMTSSKHPALGWMEALSELF